MTRASGLWPLRQLARAYGIQVDYTDATGQKRDASPEALIAVLRALGAPIEHEGHAARALRERRQAVWRTVLEPVHVVWDGQPAELSLRLPAAKLPGRLSLDIELESGANRRCVLRRDDWIPKSSATLEGVSYTAFRGRLPGPWPDGRHRVRLDTGGHVAESWILSAPRRAERSPAGRSERAWGVFLPLYALHSERSWGAGDLGDLAALMEWTESLGGSAVATLPLLASFLDQPFEPSPYAPVSRLFWNEMYLDVERVPELADSPAARSMLDSPALRREIRRLRRAPQVDYRRQMALKRRVLEELARSLFSGRGKRLADFRRFVRSRPEVEVYARFRAAVELRRDGWPAWPEPLRSGVLREQDYEADSSRYHQYVQWLAEQQLGDLARRGVALYLDMPLGVHPAGYDVWREGALFAGGNAVGAPPDPFFTRGQNWGFPPIHPDESRRQGHRYLAASLQNHLRFARVLRLDHVMGLHRQLWIPDGLEAAAGVYVRYPAEELYAVLCLESRRQQSVLVGEDLGTVPPEVRPALARHGLRRLYVLQLELPPDGTPPPVPEEAVAALNTHDMVPFAGFWRGRDLRERLALGLVDRAGARHELASREVLKSSLAAHLHREGWIDSPAAPPGRVMAGCLRWLAASRAPMLVLNLEDLWLETRPQNVPGTTTQRPNWRVKSRHALERFTGLPRVLKLLGELDRLRKQT